MLVVDTSNSTAESDFSPLKAEVGKLNINKLVDVPTGMNNLKAKLDDCDMLVRWKPFLWTWKN